MVSPETGFVQPEGHQMLHKFPPSQASLLIQLYRPCQKLQANFHAVLFFQRFCWIHTVFFVCFQHRIYSFCPISTFSIWTLSPYRSVKCTSGIFHFFIKCSRAHTILDAFPVDFPGFILCLSTPFFRRPCAHCPFWLLAAVFPQTVTHFARKAPSKSPNYQFPLRMLSLFSPLFCLNRYSFSILRDSLFSVF